MILLMHILIALTSTVVATGTFLKPTTRRLAVSYGFIVATVGSGGYLIVTSSESILHSCLVGLVYVTAISIVTIATHARVRTLALGTEKSE